MKPTTNSSQSTESPSSDAVLESVFQPHSAFQLHSAFQPHSAVGSTWGETLATASTRLLHEWLDDETANREPQAGDVA